MFYIWFGKKKSNIKSKKLIYSNKTIILNLIIHMFIFDKIILISILRQWAYKKKFRSPSLCISLDPCILYWFRFWGNREIPNVLVLKFYLFLCMCTRFQVEDLLFLYLAFSINLDVVGEIRLFFENVYHWNVKWGNQQKLVNKTTIYGTKFFSKIDFVFYCNFKKKNRRNLKLLLNNYYIRH